MICSWAEGKMSDHLETNCSSDNDVESIKILFTILYFNYLNLIEIQFEFPSVNRS